MLRNSWLVGLTPVSLEREGAGEPPAQCGFGMGGDRCQVAGAEGGEETGRQLSEAELPLCLGHWCPHQSPRPTSVQLLAGVGILN